MIVFAKFVDGKAFALATQPDGTATANFTPQTVVKYDAILYVRNDISLIQGAEIPFSAIQADPAPLPKLNLHVTLSGGDGRTPPGYNISNPAPIMVHAELHLQVPDPTSPGDVLDIIPPVSGAWRIPFTGTSVLYREVTLTDGQTDFPLTDIPEGGFTPAVDQFDRIDLGGQLYEVQIIGDPRFVGYRVAALA